MTNNDISHNFYCLDTLSWNHGGPNNHNSGVCHTCYGPVITFDESFRFLQKIPRNSQFFPPIIATVIVLMLVFIFNKYEAISENITKQFSTLDSNIYTLALVLTLLIIILNTLRPNLIKLTIGLMMFFYATNILQDRFSWIKDLISHHTFLIAALFFLCWQLISRNKIRLLFVLSVFVTYILFAFTKVLPVLITSTKTPVEITILLNSIFISSGFSTLFLLGKDQNLQVFVKTMIYYLIWGITGLFFYSLLNRNDTAAIIQLFAFVPGIVQFTISRSEMNYVLFFWMVPQLIKFFWGLKIQLLRLPEKFKIGFSKKAILDILDHSKVKAFDRVIFRVDYEEKRAGGISIYGAIFNAIAGKILYEWGESDAPKVLFELSRNTILNASKYYKRKFRRDYAISTYFSASTTLYENEERIRRTEESVAIFLQLNDRKWLMRSLSQLIWLYYLTGNKKRTQLLIKEFFRLGTPEGLELMYLTRVKSVRTILKNGLPGEFELSWRVTLGNHPTKEVCKIDLQIMVELEKYFANKDSEIDKNNEVSRVAAKKYLETVSGDSVGTKLFTRAAHYSLNKNSDLQEHHSDICYAIANAVYNMSRSIGVKENREKFINEYRLSAENSILLSFQLRKYEDAFNVWQKYKSMEISEDLSVSLSQNSLNVLKYFSKENRTDRFKKLVNTVSGTVYRPTRYIQQDRDDEWRSIAYFVKSLKINIDDRDKYESDIKILWLGLKGIFSGLFQYSRSLKLLDAIDYVTLLYNLDNNQMLVEYCVIQNRVFVFLARRLFFSPKAFEIQLRHTDVGDLISSTFENPQTMIYLNDETVIEWAKYVEPLQKFLKQNDTIIIVPSGFLYQMPFHALSIDGKSLMESYPITYLPSTSIIRHIRLAKKKRSQKNKLIIGDPTNNLPHAKREAEEISKLYKYSPLIGEEASLNNVVNHALKAGVIHLASHANFNSANQEETGILLSDHKLSIEDIYTMNLNCDLVVLSACQSGVNYVSLSDKLYGFTSAFLFAGSKNVLVSLWPIDDDISSAIMINFHKKLIKGLPPKTALQQACLAVKKENSNIYFWAPFILIGN